MFRYAFSAVAAAAITFGTVSALNAETPSKVTIDHKTGNYCVTDAEITGSHIAPSECHSVDQWAKLGVTFSRAPAK
jgi:hypothetical protein